MYKRLILASALLTFLVVVFGAFVRLTDAGLGCPDWPGCYGQISVPRDKDAQLAAQMKFPGRPIETAKAWIEMIHRYLAGSLGLLILALGVVAWRKRNEINQSHILPTLLVAVVAFQALLGMWTITLLLKPLVVTLHLLGGMLTLALLTWLGMEQLSPRAHGQTREWVKLRGWGWLGLLVLFVQIALGGWVSANYAAMACTDFPLCRGEWLPEMDFRHGFQILRELGVTAAGTPLSHDALTAIHWTHRAGALATFVYLGILAIFVAGVRHLNCYGLALLALLIVQVSLGVANVLLSLPLWVAVAHNAAAALLLILLVMLNFELNNYRV